MSSMMQTKSEARTTARTRDHSDGSNLGMEAYFSDLEREGLMDAEQERIAAEQILRLRHEYWKRLLGYPPFLDAMLAMVQGELASRGRKAKTMAKMLTAAETFKGRPRRLERARAEAIAAAFAKEMADLDPSVELADRLLADLQSIDAGRGCEAGLDVRAPARGSATFQRYLHGVRSASLALGTARHELVRANLRLVVKMAHRYRRSGRLSLADLIQEGNMGLLVAVDRFDPRKGFRFSTYGSWWIRHAIGRALSDKGRAVRLPVHVVELQHRMGTVRREFELEHGRTPDAAELAAALGVPEAKLERLQRSLLVQDTTFDSPNPEGGPQGMDVLRDAKPDVDSLMHGGHLDDAVQEALSSLRPMEADILRHRYGLDDGRTLTLREVGVMHGLSRERIRQLQERALEKIREQLRERGFELKDWAPL